MIKEWRVIHGYGNYLVSNHGEVKIIYPDGVERILRVIKKKEDTYVFLSRNRRGNHHSIKNIVARAFFNFNFRTEIADRFDGNIINNAVDNILIKRKVTGVESLECTPLELLLNFPVPYIAKMYQLSEYAVHNNISGRIKFNTNKENTTMVKEENLIIDEFASSYYTENKKDIDGAWMSNPIRSESMKIK